MAPTLQAHEEPRGARAPKVLFVCGIVSSLLYVAIDLFTSWLWKEYSYTAQTVSELSAIGAPTTPWWKALAVVYQPLIAAFAAGVYVAAGRRRALRKSGILLFGLVIVGVAWAFFPMHQRGAPKTITDTMHVVIAAVNVPLVLVSIGFAAAALGKPFRTFSIVTLLVMLVAGVATFAIAPRVAAVLPTPGLGILERINVYGTMLWIAVLGAVLWREQRQLDRLEKRARPPLGSSLSPPVHG